MQDYDIIIVGAGLIGTSLIVALQNQGLKIAVLEKNLPDIKTLAAMQERPISLAYGSVEILKTLGVWQSLQQYSSKIEQVHVSEKGALGAVHFSASEQQVEALGYVVPYTKLHLTLYERAVNQANVDIKTISEIKRIDQVAGHVEVEFISANGAQLLTAGLVVGCDGSNSFVRDLLKIPTIKQSQQKKALTGVVTFDSAYPAIAYERFSKDGVLALLPIADRKQCGLVWTLPQEKVEEVSSWQPDQFAKFITQNFTGRLPAINSITLGASFPLTTQVATQQYQNGVLLLGNAAHTLYPLAAQGFNLGLRDVAVCAEVLVEARRNQKKLGSDLVLAQYLEWRKQDQERVLRLTNQVNRLFSVNLPLAGRLRGIGLLVSDLVSPVKKRIAKLTMGLSGKLPKLIRGLPL